MAQLFAVFIYIAAVKALCSVTNADQSQDSGQSLVGSYHI